MNQLILLNERWILTCAYRLRGCSYRCKTILVSKKTLSSHLTKQWPLAPNSPKWRITRANVSNASHSLANVGECIECRMYRVRGKWLANVGRMYRVRGKWLANVGQMYRVRGKG
jgi:hypothetical protein